MNSEEGYITLSRRFFDHWMWKKERAFSNAEAWIDLIYSAAYKPHKMELGGKEIVINRGEMPHSVRTLAKRWGWSVSKVNRFLKRLESASMVIRKRSESVQKPDQQVQLLVIVKYNDYQHETKETGSESDRDRIATGSNRIKGNKREERTTPPTPPRGRGVENFENQFDPLSDEIYAAWERQREKVGFKTRPDNSTRLGTTEIASMIHSKQLTIEEAEMAMANLLKDPEARESWGLRGLANNVSQWLTAKDASKGSKPAAPRTRKKRFVGKCECGTAFKRGVDTSGGVWWDDCPSCGKNVDMEQDGFWED